MLPRSCNLLCKCSIRVNSIKPICYRVCCLVEESQDLQTYRFQFLACGIPVPRVPFIVGASGQKLQLYCYTETTSEKENCAKDNQGRLWSMCLNSHIREIGQLWLASACRLRLLGQKMDLTFPPIFFRLASSWSIMPDEVVRTITPNCRQNSMLKKDLRAGLKAWIALAHAVNKFFQHAPMFCPESSCFDDQKWGL